MRRNLLLLLLAGLLCSCEGPKKSYPGMVEVDPIVTVYGPGGVLLQGPRSKAPRKHLWSYVGWTPEEKAAHQGAVMNAGMSAVMNRAINPTPAPQVIGVPGR